MRLYLNLNIRKRRNLCVQNAFKMEKTKMKIPLENALNVLNWSIFQPPDKAENIKYKRFAVRQLEIVLYCILEYCLMSGLSRLNCKWWRKIYFKRGKHASDRGNLFFFGRKIWNVKSMICHNDNPIQLRTQLI